MTEVDEFIEEAATVVEAVRSLLCHPRTQILLAKARNGTSTPDERAEIEVLRDVLAAVRPLRASLTFLSADEGAAVRSLLGEQPVGRA